MAGAAAALLMTAGLIATPPAVRAQTAQAAPDGATPSPSSDRPDFSGSWSLDRTLSSDLTKVNFVAPRGAAPQRNARQGGFSGGIGGFGVGGRRRGGGGSGQPQRSREGQGAGALTDLETMRIQALTDQLKNGAATIVISHHDPSFVVNDASDHTMFFRTSGESDENHVGTETITSTSRWEEGRIVTEYTISSRIKLVTTYTLLTRTNQLVARTTLQRTDAPQAQAPEARLVYTPAAARS